MTTEYGYALNYDWKHPWPRAPIPKNEAARLEELTRYQIIDSEPDEKFDKLCRIACKEMKCPIAAVSFIDKQKQWFKANAGLTQKQIPRDVALCAHTIMTPKRPLVVEDASLDPRFQHNPLVTRASAVRFYAGVPITTPNGYCIGSVFVFDIKAHENVDAKILLKIAAKVLKYMDERLRVMNGESPAPPLPLARTSSDASRTSEKQELRSSTSSNRKNSVPQKELKRQTSSQTEQSPGEVTTREQDQVSKPEIKDKDSNAIVAANPSPATPSTEIAVGGPQTGQGLGNMGTMLMNLLARTTETQQQLAAQQGVMFETLGQHSTQLENLGQSMNGLEKKFEQVRLKQLARKQQLQQQK